MKNRSLGVMIAGVLCLLSGAMMLGDAFHSTRKTHRAIENMKAERVLDEAGYQRLLHENQLVGLAVLAASEAWLIAGFGVLFQLGWSRLLALICAGISVLWELGWTVPIVTHDIPFLGYLVTNFSVKEFSYELRRDLYIWLRSALIIGWYGLFLWYFTRSSVKAKFQKYARHTPTTS